MKAKLQQMNDVPTRVVEKMDDDTHLIVFGDHGGHGTLETSSSSMWLSSKGHPLIDTSLSAPYGLKIPSNIGLPSKSTFFQLPPSSLVQPWSSHPL
jgi:hypothetical protein